MRDPVLPDGFELVTVPLHEVAFRSDTVRRRVYEDGRIVDFYEAEPDQFVRAYAAGEVVWAPVFGFSKHQNIKVVIVNLSNGSQIVTDHDPRAVFGIQCGASEPERFYPDAALELGVLVPCRIPRNIGSWGAEQLRETYASLWAALNRKAEILASRRLGSRVSWDRATQLWCLRSCDLVVSDICPPQPNLVGTQWAAIESVDYTGVPETGYDLTVPGYETFMSADGVILSNTVSIHVPSSPEAVKDVREKMMASRMPWSIKDRTKTLASPKHEQILGLTMGQKPGGQRRKFATDDEAMAAIEAGQVDLNDDIEITK